MRSQAMVLACALAGAAGCYKATFIRDPQAIRGVEHDEWVNFFIFGLVGEKSIDVHQFCPDGRVAQVQTGGNFGTSLIGGLTIGIYTPRKVYVTCAADPGGRASRLELFGDRAGRLVAAIKHVGDREVPATITEGARRNSWQLSFAEVQP